MLDFAASPDSAPPFAAQIGDLQRRLEAEAARRIEAEARAESAEAEAAALLARNRELRTRLGSLQFAHSKLKQKHEAAAGELRSLRRELRDPIRLQKEVERLRGLLAEAKVDSRRNSPLMRLRKEAAGLREELRHSEAERASLQDRLRVSEAGHMATRDHLKRVLGQRAELRRAAFGRRSEKSRRVGGTSDAGGDKRPRGQQPGAGGHGRTPRPDLGARTETLKPDPDRCLCKSCGKPYVANGAHASEIIEIAVKAHVRRIRRPRFRRGCDCSDSPAQAAAAPVPRLFPNTPFGTSVWALYLNEACGNLRPIRRAAAWLSDQGLAVSAGTLAGRHRDFLRLFRPIEQAIAERLSQAALCQGDETGWRVQEFAAAGRRSARAWLWMGGCADCVRFLVDRSRSAEAAARLFAGARPGAFLVCDRYSACRKLARLHERGIVLCFCWSHARRDFLACASGDDDLLDWQEGWMRLFGAAFAGNRRRLQLWDPARGLDGQDGAFKEADAGLRLQVGRLFAAAEAESGELPETDRRRKALQSLARHRDGLSVFLDHPQAPMDNNFSERNLRGAAILRKLAFGSDSAGGAEFTAVMPAAVRTMRMNGLDAGKWLEQWLEACAAGRGPPSDLGPRLPWSMGRRRRERFGAGSRGKAACGIRR